MGTAAENLLNVVFNDPKWMNSFVEGVPDGILIADADGVVHYVNDGYLKVTGLKPADILNRRLSDVRPGALLPKVLLTGKTMSGIYRKEGDTEYVVDLAPIIHNGKIIGGVGVIKDLARILLLSKELEKYADRTRELKSVVNRAYSARYTFEDIIGASAAIQKTVSIAKRTAQFEADILITGESGTGKEVFAQAIHNASLRAGMPFVPVNCSTLSSTLAESELFGYEDGAFTGARKGGHVGLFSVADGGTILLDEVGDLPLEMQAKLLRVLQERKVRKVGKSNELDVNIRVIAATNKNLASLTKSKMFREDLYYRLNAINLNIPSLRERENDVALLANFFLEEWSKKNGRYYSFHPDVYDALSQYNWPGNIRELKHVIEFAAYTGDGNVIRGIPLPRAVSDQYQIDGILKLVEGPINLRKFVADAEQAVIQALFDKHGDSLEAKKAIADHLGISLGTLYNKSKSIIRKTHS